MPKSRLSALLSLILVFASGILVGAVGYRLYTVNTASATRRDPPPSPEEVRKRLVSEMRQRLTLNDEQATQLDRIYAYTREKFDEVHKKANSETRALWDDQTAQIRAMLNPEQLAKFEQWRKERDAERKKRRMEGKGGLPPPRP